MRQSGENQPGGQIDLTGIDINRFCQKTWQIGRDTVILTIGVGTDPKIYYLITVKQQYTVYSLSGELTGHNRVQDEHASRFSASGFLLSRKFPKSGTADEPHDTFQGRNAVNQMRLPG